MIEQYFRKLQVAFEIFTMGLRATGRTTRLMNEVKPNDVVFFLKHADAQSFNRSCQYHRGFQPRTVVTSVESGRLNIEAFMEIQGDIGNVHFEHRVVEEVAMKSIFQAEDYIVGLKEYLENRKKV